MARTVSHAGHLAVIQHKRGDTFTYSGKLTSANKKKIVDATNWTIKAHIKSKSQVYELSANWLDEEKGIFHVVLSEEVTETWPLERMKLDIEFTTASNTVISSPTVTIVVQEDITQ